MAGVSDSEEELGEERGKTYFQEQEELKASFQAAVSKVGGAEEEALLVPRVKTEEDKVDYSGTVWS